MDWSAIKTEYITDGSTSYRKLAKKYGVSVQGICDRSKREGWIEQRERFLNKTLTEAIEASGERQVGNAVLLLDVTEKLLKKIDRAVDVFDMQELFTDKQALRQITGALKDIKDIQGIKTEADKREQEARIEKLRRDCGGGDPTEGKPSGVVMMPPIMGDLVPPSEGDESG